MAEAIYLIRHGRTDWNDIHAFMGRKVNVGLNKEGIRQVKELAEHFPAPPELILHSPLRRAVETVNILAEKWSFEAKEEQKLTEVDFGTWTGKREKEVSHTEAFQNYLKDPGKFSPPQGESLHDVQERVIDVVQYALSLNRQRVGLVSHMDVIRAALCYFLKCPLQEAFQLHIHTASLSAIVPHQKPSVVLVNWMPPSVVDYFPRS